MKTYTFTLILSGFTELSENVEDRVFESGCDDALLNFRDGVPYLDFDRVAESLIEAIITAINDIEGTGIGARVIRVEPDELVTASEIAERTGRSRESIRLLAEGKRGKGDFPPPLRGVKSRTRFWRWAEVALWISEHGGKLSGSSLDEAHTIAAVNGALELRRHAPGFSIDLIKRIAG